LISRQNENATQIDRFLIALLLYLAQFLWVPTLLAGVLALLSLVCLGWPWLVLALWPRFSSPQEPAHPFPKGLPDQEIVFMPDAGPHEQRWDARTLGFIHPDGSGRLEFTFPMLTGYRSMFGHPEARSKASYPRWSPQGDLVFIIGGIFPVRLIDGKTGRMYGRDCDVFGGPGLPRFDSQGHLLTEPNRRSARSEAYRAHRVFERSGATMHLRLDLKTCRIRGQLDVPRIEGTEFWAYEESPTGWIVARGWPSKAEPRLLLYHPARGLREIFAGAHPSFSRDGTWLAYYDLEGYLVVRPVEVSSPQRLVRVFDPSTEDGGWLAPPGWSPDGSRLVYGTPTGQMFVVDRRTSVVRLLGPGWAPDWRPAPAPGTHLGGEGEEARPSSSGPDLPRPRQRP
jgi:hypothetical protein